MFAGGGREKLPAKQASKEGGDFRAVVCGTIRPVRGAQAQPGVKVGVSYRSYLNGCIHRVTVSSRETLELYRDAPSDGIVK